MKSFEKIDIMCVINTPAMFDPISLLGMYYRGHGLFYQESSTDLDCVGVWSGYFKSIKKISKIDEQVRSNE